MIFQAVPKISFQSSASKVASLYTELECCPANWHQRLRRLLDSVVHPRKSTTLHDACIACKRRRSQRSLPRVNSVVCARGTGQVHNIRTGYVGKKRCALRVTCKHARAMRRDFAGGGSSSGHELWHIIRFLVMKSHAAVVTFVTKLNLLGPRSILFHPAASNAP